MTLKVRRETERPAGRSISWSQISAAQTCGLRLKFQRERVKQKGVSVHLLYGRGLHAGIEARSKGRARTDEEAARIAVSTFRFEMERQKEPIAWDEPMTTLKDGSPSAETYGKLCTPEVCEWWLRFQVPLYLGQFPDQQVVRSEHHIFVPLTPKPNWTTPWSFECYLDREMADGSILDLKSSNDRWDEADVRKNAVQAYLYMSAYWWHYSRLPEEQRPTPTGRPTHFEFHVLPRLRAESKKGKDIEPLPLVQVTRIEWDQQKIQRLIDSIVRPQVDAIEAGCFVANPGSRLCNSRWCGYWPHCAHGAGENL